MKKIKKLILRPFIELFNLFKKLIIHFPDGTIGSKLRLVLWKLSLSKVGKNLIISSGAKYSYPNLIEINNNVILGNNVAIHAGDSKGIYIGNYVAIADGTYIRSGNHKFDNLNTKIMYQDHDCVEIDFNFKKFSVVIEDDVWIGARVILLSGAHIGEGSVISAGSVVSNKIPPYSVAVGNPARVVANRKM